MLTENDGLEEDFWLTKEAHQQWSEVTENTLNQAVFTPPPEIHGLIWERLSDLIQTGAPQEALGAINTAAKLCQVTAIIGQTKAKTLSARAVASPPQERPDEFTKALNGYLANSLKTHASRRESGDADERS